MNLTLIRIQCLHSDGQSCFSEDYFQHCYFVGYQIMLWWVSNKENLDFSIKPDLIELFFEEIKILHAGYKCLHLGFLFASSPAKWVNLGSTLLDYTFYEAHFFMVMDDGIIIFCSRCRFCHLHGSWRRQWTNVCG